MNYKIRKIIIVFISTISICVVWAFNQSLNSSNFVRADVYESKLEKHMVHVIPKPLRGTWYLKNKKMISNSSYFLGEHYINKLYITDQPINKIDIQGHKNVPAYTNVMIFSGNQLDIGFFFAPVTIKYDGHIYKAIDSGGHSPDDILYTSKPTKQKINLRGDGYSKAKLVKIGW